MATEFTAAQVSEHADTLKYNPDEFGLSVTSIAMLRLLAEKLTEEEQRETPRETWPCACGHPLGAHVELKNYGRGRCLGQINHCDCSMFRTLAAPDAGTGPPAGRLAQLEKRDDATRAALTDIQNRIQALRGSYGTVGDMVAKFDRVDAGTGEARTFDFAAHLSRQREFSERTFGPGRRTAGVVQHIRKELTEIEAQPEDISEWIDVAILALDGAWRHGYSPEQIIDALVAKQTKNEGRVWPDWRLMTEGQAIEHDRSADTPPAPLDLAAVLTDEVRASADKARVSAFNDLTRSGVIQAVAIIASHGQWRAVVAAALTPWLASRSAESATKLKRIEDDAEFWRMALAACSSAALGNTRESVKDRLKPGDAYWTATYGDVCRAVDAEIEARERSAESVQRIAALTQDVEHAQAVNLADLRRYSARIDELEKLLLDRNVVSECQSLICPVEVRALAAESRLAEVAQAARALLTKLTEVEKATLWMFARNPTAYNGPTYGTEVELLKNALSRLPATGEGPAK